MPPPNIGVQPPASGCINKRLCRAQSSIDIPIVIDMAASPDSVLPTVKAFLENFYRLSDDPSANSEYVDQFTKDGEIVVASNKAKGYNGGPV